VDRRKRSILLGIMSEICIKARILGEKLKKNPDMAHEIFELMDALEEEMLACAAKFESQL